jgi:LemA protein
MKTGSIVLIVVLALLVFGGCATCNVQKSLVTLDEGVKKEWAQVQNQYQRRADLIPNLVRTVQGSATFESKTLTDVINARAKATSIQIDPDKLTPEKLKEFQAAQGELSQALGRLLVVTENYPQLRSTEAFRDLQVQLEGTENRITTERGRYNEAVMAYNTQLRVFPNNVFGGMMGFQPRGTFTADAASQKAPEVQFN